MKTSDVLLIAGALGAAYLFRNQIKQLIAGGTGPAAGPQGLPSPYGPQPPSPSPYMTQPAYLPAPSSTVVPMHPYVPMQPSQYGGYGTPPVAPTVQQPLLGQPILRPAPVSFQTTPALFMPKGIR